jgi:hypothetical protein
MLYDIYCWLEAGIFRYVFFEVIVRKKRPSYSRFNSLSLHKQGKLPAENDFGLKAIGDHLQRCKSAVFLQSECNFASVSTRTETDGFTWLSRTGSDTIYGNGAR